MIDLHQKLFHKEIFSFLQSKKIEEMDQIVGNQGLSHIVEKIVKSMDEKTLLNFGFVNKNFHESVENPKVWLKKCVQYNLLKETESVWKEYINLSHEQVEIQRSIARTLRKICMIGFEFKRQTKPKSPTPITIWSITQEIGNLLKSMIAEPNPPKSTEKEIDFFVDKEMLNIWKFLDQYPVLMCPLNMSILANDELLTQFILDMPILANEEPLLQFIKPFLETEQRCRHFHHGCLVRVAAEHGNIDLIKDLEPYIRRCMKIRQIEPNLILVRKTLYPSWENIEMTKYLCTIFLSEDPKAALLGLNTALHWAVLKNKVDKVKMLAPMLRLNPDIPMFQIFNRPTNSTISVAVQIGNIEIIKTLLQHWKGPYRFTKENLPLKEAVLLQNVEIVELILPHVSNINYEDEDGETILNIAAKLRTDVLRAIIPYINREDISDRLGRTPLHAAAYANNHSALKILHESGYNKIVTDFYGRTPLHYAAYFGNKEAVEVLISLYGGLDNQDDCGATPIFVAAEKGFSEIVAILAPIVNFPLAANNDGHTPIMKAKLNGHEDIQNILLPYCEDEQFMTEIVFDLIMEIANR